MHALSLRRFLLAVFALASAIILFGAVTAARADNGKHKGHDKDHHSNNGNGNEHSTTTTTCSPSTTTTTCPGSVTTTTLPTACPDPGPVTCTTDDGGSTVVVVPPCPAAPACICPLPPGGVTFPTYRLCKARKDGSLKCKSNVRLTPVVS